MSAWMQCRVKLIDSLRLVFKFVSHFFAHILVKNLQVNVYGGLELKVSQLWNKTNRMRAEASIAFIR